LPTYEYACRSCGRHIEVSQSFSDPPLTTCATCGGQLRKVFSPIGITFKGSGFYRTDSRRDGRAATREPGSAASKDGAASSEPGASAATSSDGSSSSSGKKEAAGSPSAAS
jgi:putative FmdB family regulatory protein